MLIRGPLYTAVYIRDALGSSGKCGLLFIRVQDEQQTHSCKLQQQYFKTYIALSRTQLLLFQTTAAEIIDFASDERGCETCASYNNTLPPCWSGHSGQYALCLPQQCNAFLTNTCLYYYIYYYYCWHRRTIRTFPFVTQGRQHR